MDIGSGHGYPESSLSNFAPHPFEIDGVDCASMEGFLQSLKFQDAQMQMYVCTLVGREAKFKGKHKKWYKEQVLYWQGVPIPRDSQEYQDLLDRAFNQLAKNSKFAAALLGTGVAVLKHSIGKTDPHNTVLTQQEFCSRLRFIRRQLALKRLRKVNETNK